MFEKPGKRRVVYRLRYPGEEQYNQKEKLKWSGDGRKLNGEKIISRSEGPDGTLTLVTRDTGNDNNQPADIRMTYAFSATAIEIRKEVRPRGTDAFFERNAYVLEPMTPEAAANAESE
jgi:hypothetical protein